MSEKRNEFLDASDSDEDVGRNSDSDDDFQKGGRTAKKPSVDHEDDSDPDEFFSGDEQRQNDHDDEEGGGTKLSKDGEEDTGPSKDSKSETATKKPTKESPSKADNLSNITKPLTKKNLVATEEAVKKSGVVYLSRVPPFMKPLKLRSLLEPYGMINRIFLAPEDPAEYARRVRNGGNKKRSYSEGWVEFVKKKDAKKAVDLLNAQTIGGKKSSWYRDDVWTLKYLNGFKWHHLTEQIAAENAERASRMRAEISKATKENKEFVRNVERAKVQKTQETKAATKRKKTEDEEDGGTAAAGNGGEDQTKKPRRTFAQVPLAKKRKQEEQPDHVQRVLSKIF